MIVLFVGLTSLTKFKFKKSCTGLEHYLIRNIVKVISETSATCFKTTSEMHLPNALEKIMLNFFSPIDF